MSGLASKIAGADRVDLDLLGRRVCYVLKTAIKHGYSIERTGRTWHLRCPHRGVDMRATDDGLKTMTLRELNIKEQEQ